MSDLDNLANIIRTESTWSAVMSDGYTSVGQNSPEHIAQAIIKAGWQPPPTPPGPHCPNPIEIDTSTYSGPVFTTVCGYPIRRNLPVNVNT